MYDSLNVGHIYMYIGCPRKSELFFCNYILKIDEPNSLKMFTV